MQGALLLSCVSSRAFDSVGDLYVRKLASVAVRLIVLSKAQRDEQKTTRLQISVLVEPHAKCMLIRDLLQRRGRSAAVQLDQVTFSQGPRLVVHEQHCNDRYVQCD